MADAPRYVQDPIAAPVGPIGSTALACLWHGFGSVAKEATEDAPQITMARCGLPVIGECPVETEPMNLVSWDAKHGEDVELCWCAVDAPEDTGRVGALMASKTAAAADANATLEAHPESPLGPKSPNPTECSECKGGLVEVDACTCGGGLDVYGHEPLCGTEPCPNGCWDKLHPAAEEYVSAMEKAGFSAHSTVGGGGEYAPEPNYPLIPPAEPPAPSFTPFLAPTVGIQP